MSGQTTRVLLLGGTADARKVVALLDQAGLMPRLMLTYSVAGLVRRPKLDCEILSGGFSQFGGLAHYCREQKIELIVDVTHPYALTMSSTAARVADELSIPLARFHRPTWQPQAGDRWRGFEQESAIWPALADYRSVLLTVGQVEQKTLQQLRQQNLEQRLILRTAASPKFELPAGVEWLKAIGPFALEDEAALLRRYEVDLLVSKNSGGDSTVAKLDAARQLGIDVFMLNRPELAPAANQFETPEACADWIGRQVA